MEKHTKRQSLPAVCLSWWACCTSPSLQSGASCRVEENKQRSKLVELEAQGDVQRAAILRRRLESPPVAELHTDIAALAQELERCYGQTKRMPTRAELRADNRY